VATASRPETDKFCRSMGADFIIDHTKDFSEEMKRIGIPEGVEYVYDTFGLPSSVFEAVVKVVKPFGKVVTIVEQSNPVNITAGMVKKTKRGNSKYVFFVFFVSFRFFFFFSN
jgi:NADPH2:quinone reductase